MLVKDNGEFHALGHKCPHYGAPLVKGELSRYTWGVGAGPPPVGLATAPSRGDALPLRGSHPSSTRPQASLAPSRASSSSIGGVSWAVWKGQGVLGHRDPWRGALASDPSSHCPSQACSPVAGCAAPGMVPASTSALGTWRTSLAWTVYTSSRWSWVCGRVGASGYRVRDQSTQKPGSEHRSTCR